MSKGQKEQDIKVEDIKAVIKEIGGIEKIEEMVKDTMAHLPPHLQELVRNFATIPTKGRMEEDAYAAARALRNALDKYAKRPGRKDPLTLWVEGAKEV